MTERFHFSEQAQVLASCRDRDNYTDDISVYAIGKDDDDTACGMRISSAYPSSTTFTVGMSLADLEALRHAITRLLVKVQAETEPQSPSVVTIPTMATGMASVHTPASMAVTS